MSALAHLRVAVATIMVAAAIVATPLTVYAQDGNRGEAAGQFIETLGSQAISKLSNADKSKDARQQEFRQLLRDGFAMNAISRFVLGRYWRVASEKEQTRFQETFERVLTQRFLPLFEGYEQDDFVVVGAGQDPAQPKLYAIETRVAQPNNPQAEKVRVVWRVRPTDGSFEILDVQAEGVSMAITLRSEYNSAIKQAGGNVSQLIAQLEKNLAKGAYAPDEAGDVAR